MSTPTIRNDLIRFFQSAAFAQTKPTGMEKVWWNVLENAQLRPKDDIPRRWPLVNRFERAFETAKRFTSHDPEESRSYLKNVHLAKDDLRVSFTASDGQRFIQFTRTCTLPPGFTDDGEYVFQPYKLNRVWATPSLLTPEFFRRKKPLRIHSVDVEALTGRMYGISKVLRFLKWKTDSKENPELVHYPNVGLQLDKTVVYVSPKLLFDGLQALRALRVDRAELTLYEKGAPVGIETDTAAFFVAPMHFPNGAGRHALFESINLSEYQP